MREKYVAQLGESLQSKIKEELMKHYKDESELNAQELEEVLELAMNSRISDLEDTIKINNIV